MYSTKTAVTNNEEFNSSYMSAGINENVNLKEVNVKKSPTGLDFIEFIFENEAGQTVSMTEWKNNKGLYVKTDEDLQRADNAQFGRILQIVKSYMETLPDAELNSFAEMINWVKSTLDAVADKDSKKLRLKVIYDKNNYTVVSKNGIFVEPMTVAKEDSQIKQFKRDHFERTIVADKEDANNDPLSAANPLATESSTQEAVNTNNSGADDLPF